METAPAQPVVRPLRMLVHPAPALLAVVCLAAEAPAAHAHVREEQDDEEDYQDDVQDHCPSNSGPVRLFLPKYPWIGSRCASHPVGPGRTMVDG